MQVLAGGGNAIDAAVAAGLVASVVSVSNCGIGGYGGFLIVGWPDGKLAAIDSIPGSGRGAARTCFRSTITERFAAAPTFTVGSRLECRARWRDCNWRWTASARGRSLS